MGARRGMLAQGLLVGLVAGGMAVAAPPALAGDGAPGADNGAASAGSGAAPTLAPASAAPVASGLIMHVDPQTGDVLKEPAPGAAPLSLTPELRNALDTSHHGLFEEQGATPGAGVKVHLQGRFRNPLMATTDANGKITIQHLDERAEKGDAK